MWYLRDYEAKELTNNVVFVFCVYFKILLKRKQWKIKIMFFPGGKGGRCVTLTILPPSCVNCIEIWESQPPGTLRASPGLYRDCFTLIYE
jgi:hypothetical protein